MTSTLVLPLCWALLALCVCLCLMHLLEFHRRKNNVQQYSKFELQKNLLCGISGRTNSDVDDWIILKWIWQKFTWIVWTGCEMLIYETVFLGDLSVDGRILLRCTFEVWWHGLHSYISTYKVVTKCRQHWTTGSMKCEKNYLLPDLHRSLSSGVSYVLL